MWQTSNADALTVHRSAHRSSSAHEVSSLPLCIAGASEACGHGDAQVEHDNGSLCTGLCREVRRWQYSWQSIWKCSDISHRAGQLRLPLTVHGCRDEPAPTAVTHHMLLPRRAGARSSTRAPPARGRTCTRRFTTPAPRTRWSTAGCRRWTPGTRRSPRTTTPSRVSPLARGTSLRCESLL